MFASAGGGGKRIGSNKQNQQQQSHIQTHQHPIHPQPHQLLHQQSPIQTHQHPIIHPQQHQLLHQQSPIQTHQHPVIHPQPHQLLHQQSPIQTHQQHHPIHPQQHQLLQQHQAQQQQQQLQLQNNPLVHHNRQTPPQSATNSHPLQHSHTQQQQQPQQQQPIILQHQPKHPQQQFPVTFFSHPFGNVHLAATTSQHRPVQTPFFQNNAVPHHQLQPQIRIAMLAPQHCCVQQKYLPLAAPAQNQATAAPVHAHTPYLGGSSPALPPPVSVEVKRQRTHAVAIINPETGEEVEVKKKHQDQGCQADIAIESISVQTDDDNSTASVPTETPVEETNEEEEEEGQLTANTLPGEEQNVVDMPVAAVPVPDTHISTTAVSSSNSQSGDSATESLKICLHEDPNDTDADANEHELDNEDDVVDHLDIAKVKEIEAFSDKPPTSSSVMDDDNSCTPPSKSNDDVKTSESNFVVQKQGRNSKKGAKQNKKNKKKSKQQQQQHQQQQQQQQKTPETNKSCPITTTNRNSNNNTPPTNANASDNAKSSTSTSAIDNNKIQSEQQSEQNADNLPTIDAATNSSSNKSQKQKIVALETKGELKKDTKCKNRSNSNAVVVDKKKHFIRYTLEELKAMARSEESNKTPIVPCQKGSCISQLFVARHQQQQQQQQQHHHHHFHHSLSLTSASSSANSQNMSNVGTSSLSHQHHMHMNTAGNKIYRINLSLKEEVKLSRSKNAWQPNVLRCKADNNNAANAEQELKKVRGILNKLTLDNFQVLIKSMKDISLDGKDNIEKVMLLIFEKTVSEPNFAQIYAKFCHVLFQEIKPDSKKLFNNLLIHRLQTEFENNVNNPNAKNDTLQHITDKLNKANDPKDKLELTNEYDVEEYKFRRRAWGTVRFIGEMYKLNCLSSDRALLCLESLLDNGNEEKLEYLCKLLITVGPQLDSHNGNVVARLNNIFHKIQNIVTDAKSDATKQKVKISSRVRFMLQDVIDLRSRHWDLKPTAASSSNSAPTAMRSNASAQQHKTTNNHHHHHSSSTSSSNINLNNNYERVNHQRMNYGNNNNNQRQGRNSMHNNNNNNNNMKESGVSSSSSGHFVQKSIDIKKLNFSKGVDESSLTNTKLGNSSIYRWRNDATQQSGRNTPNTLGSGTATPKLQITTNYSQQQQQQQQPQHQQSQQHHHSSANGDEVKSQSSSHTDIQKILNSYSDEDNQKFVNHLIEEYLDCIQSRSTRWQEEIFKTWQKTTQIQQICVIYYILMDYLHLAKVKQLERSACSNIFMYIMRFGPFNKKTFARAYEQFAEDFPDLLTDVPNGWSYIFEFLGPILHEGLLTFDDVWSNTWRNDKTFTERFFKALVLYFTKEFGANYMRNMWRSECQFYYKKLFTTEQHWRQFVEANKFQFIFDRNVKPEFAKATNTSAASVEQKVQRLETLLNSADNSNLALDYINTNVNVNGAFLKRLTSFLCCDYATTMQAAVASTTTTTTTASSNTGSNKNSSTCSSSSSSGSNNSGGGGGTKSPDLKTPRLNVNLFREKCMPVLRLCLDDHEDHEMICLDAIVESMLQEYDAYSAYNLICNIFDLLYDGELIPKESFDKWYRQWQQQHDQHQQSANADTQLQAFMQKILL